MAMRIRRFRRRGLIARSYEGAFYGSEVMGMAKFYEYDDFYLMTIHAGLLAGGIDAVWREKREFLFVHSAGVMGVL